MGLFLRATNQLAPPVPGFIATLLGVIVLNTSSTSTFQARHECLVSRLLDNVQVHLYHLLSIYAGVFLEKRTKLTSIFVGFRLDC